MVIIRVLMILVVWSLNPLIPLIAHFPQCQPTEFQKLIFSKK